MRKCTTFLMMMALAIATPLGVAVAQGPPADDPVLAIDRVIDGLDENGFFIPGTTSLEVTVTISDTADGSNSLTALGVAEEIPAGWTYGGLVAGAQNPAITPQPDAQDTLDFGYIVPPALPVTFTYIVNIPEDPAGPVSITGQVLYRTSAVCPVEDPGCGAGGEIATDPNEAEDVIQEEPTIVSVERTISGDGVTGDNNEFYVAGGTITVTLNFTKTGDATVQALGFEDAISPGLTYVGLEPGASNPTIPPPSDTGTLDFGWITPPTFPFTVVYNIEVDDELFGQATLEGQGEYRLDGPAIFTNEFDAALEGQPCLSITREVTGGFTPGENVEITVTFVSDCQFGLTALGVNEQIPAGWSYVSVGGANAPSITPQPNDEDSLDFGYITPPAFPASFTYTLAVPAEETAEEAEICGTAEFRLNQPGNEGAQFSAEVCTTVSGIDETAPVITLLGDNPLELECGDAFTEPGFDAVDDRDGDVSANVVVTGSVEAGTVGSYELTYTVSDAAGNEAIETRTVNVSDTLAPVITLNGLLEGDVECGTIYDDAGAIAEDACEGDLTSEIVVDDVVNTGEPGTYTVTYDVTDAEGNAASPVVRTVNVLDTIDPVITLSGANPATVECGGSFVDPGATANDSCSGALTVTVDGVVDAETPGAYTVTYTAIDGSGNEVQAVRDVNVVDTTAPAVTLIGNETVTVECSDTYNEEGATALDDCAGDVSDSIVTSGTVDTTTPGAYTVTYTATDATGNEGTASRTVNVVDTTDPVITLEGTESVTLECGETYTDAGATASDTCDNNVDVVVDDSAVDTSVAGTYIVNITATDASGNVAEASRTVIVEDTEAPTLTLNGSATVTVECADPYSDAGAAATDSCEGDLSDAIVVDNTVDTSVPGTYAVTYNVSDGSGNAATELSRTVIVEDTTAPVLTLNGAASVELECGDEYTEAGATVSDACDDTVEVEITGSVDTSVPGTYVLTYSASDVGGNAAADLTREVVVADTIAPVITLTGTDPATIDCGEEYVDEGATATDACDGDVAVSVDASAVDNSEAGTYLVVITAVDGAGNEAETTRTVIVDGPACDPEGEPDGEGEGAPDGEGEIDFDFDNNGYPDRPFDTMTPEEPVNLQVPSASCDRASQSISWLDGGAGTIGASVINPENPSQVVTVTVPRDLIGPGEQAVLILAVSCDVVSLLSPQDATDLTDGFPEGALSGSPAIEVSLIVSSDGGATLSEITDLTSSTTASTLTITGLSFTPGLTPTIQSHPTLVEDGQDFLFVSGAAGVWSSGGVTNVQRFGSTLVVDLLSLSAFNVFEVNPVGPTLSVRPDPRFDFIVGIVEQGSSVDNVLTLSNVGSGTVTGAATLDDPAGVFEVVGEDTSYSLTGEQTRNITVRFTPTAAQSYSATLTLTNENGGDVPVQLRGTGTEFPKPTVFFGCGGEGAAGGNGYADFAVLLLALAALVGGTRMVRSRQNG